jgi:ssDNA thymidine ADP-ribosyltransferase, DarT
VSAEQPKQRLIYRIVHLDNVPWILAHGLQPPNGHQNPSYVAWGNRDVIDRRAKILVTGPPSGPLHDFVPFYFCKRHTMHYNLATGHNCEKIMQDKIIYCVSSIEKLREQALKYVVYDRNAAVATARCFSAQDPWQENLDWSAIDSTDFRYDPAQPERKHMQQAECLVHGAVPSAALLGFACGTGRTEQVLLDYSNKADVKLVVKVKPEFYFP